MSMKEVAAANGEWKFHHSVPLEEVVKIATHWKSGPDGKKYTLHIRKNSNNGGYRISFVYKLKDGTTDTYNRWLYQVIDDLIERFGRNRTEKFRCPNKVSWGISPTMIIVK